MTQKKQTLNIKKIEQRYLKYWEKQGIYKFDIKKKGKIFSIDTPPPTVSGDMHIGHAFSYSQQDFIVRFRRMFLSGKGQVFCPFGTDDNGLPTERLVERLKKVKSKEMSRERFIQLCIKTLKEISPGFIQQWKDLGISCDYDTYYSTIDDNSRRLSQKAFLELTKKGIAYKTEAPTLWCPECQTSIAQAELEDKEKTTTLNYIKGRLEDGSYVIYATTRPELHPGCIGISLDKEGDYVKVKRNNREEWLISKEAYNNMKDEFPMRIIKNIKGKDLIGKKVEILFAEQPIYFSHDVSAKTEYGTGFVYYCSYGGLDCVQWLTRHPKVKAIKVMDEFGTYTKGPCKGMKSDEAREKILELLNKERYLVKREKLKHTINTHDKCGTPIEFISTDQWFIKVLDKKNIWIKQGKKIKWFPKYMYKRYENWINGLEWDWNISRDRHFGVPIPVWYCENCNEIILADEKDLPVDPLHYKKTCSKCKKQAIPEEKVLDTWATSSLTPQIASSLIKDKVIVPYSLRAQAHDIIRTWAFYTIVRSYLHEKRLPWSNVMISGFAKLEGQKMSKSKGVFIDPKEVMEKYGSDALRYWAAGSKLGEDINYNEKDLIAGKRLITKLYNASRFVFMNLEGWNGKKPKRLEKIDEKFLIELSRVIYLATTYFEEYEYSRAKFNVEEFFWKFFCDYYLEIIKKRVYNEKGEKKKSAQYTLYKSLLTILKLIAPIMPFITEELYQTYFRNREKDNSIHISSWPKTNFIKKIEDWDDKNVKSHANEWTLFVKLLTQVRQEKTKAKKPMNAECIVTLTKAHYDDLKGMLEDFKNVTNAKQIKTGKFNVEFV